MPSSVPVTPIIQAVVSSAQCSNLQMAMLSDEKPHFVQSSMVKHQS